MFFQQNFSSINFSTNVARTFLHSMGVSHMVEEGSLGGTCFRAHFAAIARLRLTNSMDIPTTNRNSSCRIQAFADDLFARAGGIVSCLVEYFVN